MVKKIRVFVLLSLIILIIGGCSNQPESVKEGLVSESFYEILIEFNEELDNYLTETDNLNNGKFLNENQQNELYSIYKDFEDFITEQQLAYYETDSELDFELALIYNKASSYAALTNLDAIKYLESQEDDDWEDFEETLDETIESWDKLKELMREYKLID